MDIDKILVRLSLINLITEIEIKEKRELSESEKIEIIKKFIKNNSIVGKNLP